MWITLDRNKIKDLMTARSMTVETLAKVSGVSERAITGLLSGKRDRTVEENWYKLAKALKVKPQEIEGKDEQRKGRKTTA